MLLEQEKALVELGSKLEGYKQRAREEDI